MRMHVATWRHQTIAENNQETAQHGTPGCLITTLTFPSGGFPALGASYQTRQRYIRLHRQRPPRHSNVHILGAQPLDRRLPNSFICSLARPLGIYAPIDAPTQRQDCKTL